MTIEYELSESTYLKFLKKYISKTLYFKKTFFSIVIIYFLLIILGFLTKKAAGIVVTIMVIFFLLILKKKLLSSYEKKFKKLINSCPILLNKFILKIDDNLININSKYESISIPFEKIKSIFISEDYILIISKVSKDILIPTYIFDSEIEENNFLEQFKDNLKIYSFPKDYNFI